MPMLLAFHLSVQHPSQDTFTQLPLQLEKEFRHLAALKISWSFFLMPPSMLQSKQLLIRSLAVQVSAVSLVLWCFVFLKKHTRKSLKVFLALLATPSSEMAQTKTLKWDL